VWGPNASPLTSNLFLPVNIARMLNARTAMHGGQIWRGLLEGFKRLEIERRMNKIFGKDVSLNLLWILIDFVGKNGENI
jgi:hypothetical protein